MWCKHCRQDVPAIAAAEVTAAGAATSSDSDASRQEESSRYLCTRCGEPIGSLPAQWASVSDLGIDLGELALPVHAAESPLSSGSVKRSTSNAAARAEAWQWELDQELHDVRRLLKRRGTDAAKIEWRIDAAEEAPPPVLQVPAARPCPAEAKPLRQPAVVQREAPGPSSRPLSPLAWLILMAGLTASCCGGALMAWSVLSGRDELWSQGVPILIAGQVALFMALVAMLLRLGRHSQLAAARIAEMDGQLSALNSASPGESAHISQHPFYVHLAEGAAPQALLSDLKDQLDLLAVRMGRHST